MRLRARLAADGIATSDRSEAPGAIVGVSLFDLGLGVHDERTARDDRLVQRAAGVEQGPQWLVSRLDRDLGRRGAVAARKPGDIAGRDRLALGAERARALQNDDDRILVGRQVLANPGRGLEPEFDHGDGREVFRRRDHSV
jgi:hypothetical protein